MNPFIGEIRMMSFDFPPKGWALCNGQQLSKSQNQSLFAILGTTYGGDGTTNFNLPDFRGRVPLHPSPGGISLGSNGGEEQHTLQVPELAIHQHAILALDGSPNNVAPNNNELAQAAGFYQGAIPGTSLASQALSSVGNGQAHENRQPYLVISFCIALQGIFPSQS